MRYAFFCPTCNEEKEVRLPLTLPQEAYQAQDCSQCQTKMKRIYQPTPVHFNGSGWACRASGKNAASS